MRWSLLAAAAITLMGATPSLAREYPWCSRINAYGMTDTPQCDFSTYEQCRATVSGQGGDCVQNPKMGYGSYGYGAPTPYPYSRRRPY